eukprot:SAG31_NODE_14107_length_827_cov_0.898352_1_plen_94_part_01
MKPPGPALVHGIDSTTFDLAAYIEPHTGAGQTKRLKFVGLTAAKTAGDGQQLVGVAAWTRLAEVAKAGGVDRASYEHACQQLKQAPDSKWVADV